METFVSFDLASGPIANPMRSSTVVFDETLDAGFESRWVYAVFSDVVLPRGSRLRVTSLLDGQSQTLDAHDLKLWGNRSAAFAGRAVRVELVAGPNTSNNYIEIEALVVSGEPSSLRDPEAPATICGEIDNRNTSGRDYVGRLISAFKTPQGDTFKSFCTAFIIDRPDAADDKVHLSAGHCFWSTGYCDGTQKALCDPAKPSSWPKDCGTCVEWVALPDSAVFEMRVPDSEDDCTPNLQADPQWQFPVAIPVAADAVNGGVGNDFAVFRCGKNNEDKTTYEKANPASRRAFKPALVDPSQSEGIRVIGYGADRNLGELTATTVACMCDPDGTTGSRNLVQQIASGQIQNDVTATGRIEHDTDTCGGNSGSPIFDADISGDQQVYGIHTHSGCPTGNNKGTRILDPDLEAAVTRVERVLSANGQVPTVSEWGVIVMTLLLLTAGTVAIGWRRRPAAS